MLCSPDHTLAEFTSFLERKLRDGTHEHLFSAAPRDGTGKNKLGIPASQEKQNEQEFAAWKKALTSGHMVHTWSSELPWAWASLVLQATGTKRSHTEGRPWLVSRPSVDKLVLKKSSGV